MVEERINSTRVTIFGETYNIRSQAEPEYTQMVAEHVNQTMQSIKKKVGLQEALKIAILAAMSITDELFQSRDAAEQIREELDSKCDSLLNLIESYMDRHKAEKLLSG
ncbi:MAG TPA: cell division protein ZapA [archaeon]|nr:cell division protein ZapA [archaeon]